MTTALEKSRKEMFHYLDFDRAGKLSQADFKFAVRAVGVVIAESEIDLYFKMMNSGGFIAYDPYSKLIDTYLKKQKVIMNEECQLSLLKELRVAFDRMDRRKKGLVLLEDVRKYLTTLGEKISEQEFKEVFIRHVVKSKGLKELNFEQFFKIVIGMSTYNLRQ